MTDVLRPGILLQVGALLLLAGPAVDPGAHLPLQLLELHSLGLPLQEGLACLSVATRISSGLNVLALAFSCIFGISLVL